jgi:hypothetical protein
MCIPPSAVVLEYLFPRGIVVWKVPPLASGSFAIEDRIDDVTPLVLGLGQIGEVFRFRNVFPENFPLCIR